MTIDLSTTWLGLRLAHPLVASAGPLTGRVDTLRKLEDGGVSAVVLPSIFEEEIEHADAQMHFVHEQGAETFAEAAGGYLPPLLDDVARRSDLQLDLIGEAKAALDIPVIASLNGHEAGGWTRYAERIEAAGADALELNVYEVPADISRSGAEVEAGLLALVREVRATTKLPLAVKISPFFTSPGHVAMQLAAAGADGLVLFNRFVQPDIDLERLMPRPHVTLSHPGEVRLPLRWIALLRGRVEAGLAATSGVHGVDEVLQLLLAGADVTMMTSALLKHGPAHPQSILHDLQEWLEAREYDSVEQMKGSLSQAHAPEPDAFERAQYHAALRSYVWQQGW